MKNRNLIGLLGNNLGQDVQVAGWVDKVRDQKRMQFLVLRDHTGYVQAINEKNGKKLDEIVSSVSPESTVTAQGRLVENPKARLNGYELVLNDLSIQSSPQGVLPITSESSQDLRLDWRYLDLRDPKKYLIFQIQTTAEHAMREYWLENGFTEMHSPKLVEGASESGAELFQLDYFGKKASLAQSPQFYKQMAMAAGFDRVFEIGPVFRANPSFTSRHDTEFTSVDMELSWINSHEEVMEFEENWINYFVSKIKQKHGEKVKNAFGVEVTVPTVPFPRVTMDQAYQILEGQGYIVPREAKGDLDPEGERRLGAYIKERFGHDFVFVTDYPAKSRAFYHMRFDDRPETTKSFDLLWNGLEVTTGAQREHRIDKLIAQGKEKGVDLGSIQSYVDFFKYGVPPHGGCGFGLTRMLMNLTGLKNVREVTYVYRGPNRLTP
ncbi:Aspartate--tRNA(Asp) ligase [uncultured archaeon]|nr:Aspartate--tRNA(Asp) ligase [uncultured archaeon]